MNHGGSALEKADPCPDMDCATTNGSGSRICCQGGSGMLASPLKTTADLSRRSSIATVPEFRGVTCRNALVIGKTFTDGSAAGRRPGCGNGCLSTSPARPTTNTPCSNARSCGRTSTAPALPKKDEDPAIDKSRGGSGVRVTGADGQKFGRCPPRQAGQ